jgi:hypothetical protein
MLLEVEKTEAPVRRRTQRILARFALHVSGELQDGKLFQEASFTTAIYADGGLLQLRNPVRKGQRLKLLQESTGQMEVCTVAQVESIPGRFISARVQFSKPHPEFWHVAFPPEDWTRTHADSKFNRPSHSEIPVAVGN